MFLLIMSATVCSQQRDSMYCYNVNAGRRTVWVTPDVDVSFRLPGMSQVVVNDTTESADATVSARSVPVSTQRFIPSRFLSFAILKSHRLKSHCDFGLSLFNSYNEHQEEREDYFPLIEEYKSDFARNVFWERSIGRSKLVMNGAKGFSDFFLSGSMGSHLDFVSPKIYRKCTVAYSTPLKWATLGAGVDFRSWALRIFLVTW